MKTGIIIIDPGHCGRVNAGGSGASCAVSALSDLVGISILKADQLKLEIQQVYSTWKSIHLFFKKNRNTLIV